MSKSIFATLFLIFVVSLSFAQNNYEYIGVLKLNDSSFISYRLFFKLEDKVLKGYSVTDLGGAHETKSYIKGSFDKENKKLSFSEYGIEYTKSPVDTYDFCFVNFEGKVRNIDRKRVIDGDFKGLYEDGTKCIDGEIQVKSVEKLYKQAKKLNKKIQRIKRIPDSVKQKADMVKIIDEQRLNVLKKDELTTVFWNTDEVIISLWDAGKEDGDRVSLRFNEKTILRNHLISGRKKSIKLKLEKGKNKLSIKAENMGEIVPNTAKLTLTGGGKTIDLLTNLSTKEETILSIVRMEKK